MDVGVVIGRFQVENLHEGHRFIINNTLNNHRKVIIFIGVAQIVGTRNDALDYPTRQRMLQQEFPDVVILPLSDCFTDEAWSNSIDNLIKTVFPNVTSAVLYGGRNSFVPHYHGQYKAVEIDGGISYKNGTQQRKEIGKVVRSSPDFRAGIIYSTQNSFPYTIMAVDIALIQKLPGKPQLILLGRKENENKWRLPGGKVDKGETLEQAACRELKEETGIIHCPGEYIGSFPVDDWRFADAPEIGILSALFLMYCEDVKANSSDDLVDVAWFDFKNAIENIIEFHKPLLLQVITRR